MTRLSQGVYMIRFFKSFLEWDVVRRDVVDIPAVFVAWYILLKFVGGSISSSGILIFFFVIIPIIHFVNFNIRYVSSDGIGTKPH